MKKFLRRLLFACLAIVVPAAIVGWLYVQHLLRTPYKGYSEPRVLITIRQGSSLASILHALEQRGVIRDPWLLKAIFLYNDAAGKSKAGDYVFDRPLTPLQVFEKLMKGEISYTVLTVPEGSTIFDIEAVAVSKKICNAAEFRQALYSPRTLQALKSIDPSLTHPEGYLFPETYFLSKKDNAQDAILMMIREFKKHFGQEEVQRAQSLGMTVNAAVTLASLVEKEAKQPSERPLIAGVFHNRLQRSMLLECDPTVIYAMKLQGIYGGIIHKSDLKRPSPYNTYVNPGLPPGPICNPGAASIQAALYPAKTDKLFFVAKNDGTHYFSSTLAEHNRAVYKYQR